MADVLIERGHAYLSNDVYDNTRTLNMGFLKLEKMHSILGFRDICEQDINTLSSPSPPPSFHLNYDNIMVREEVAYICSTLEVEGNLLDTEVIRIVVGMIYCIKSNNNNILVISSN